MNSSNYKVIVFDLGNVLINFDYNIITNSFNSIKAGLGNKFEKLYYENYHIHEQFEKNEISLEAFTEIMLSWLDNKLTKEDFYKTYSEIFSVNEKMTRLLSKLSQKNKLFLLSNTNVIHQKYGWEKYEFLNHFDKLFLSHELGARKPEKKIFELVQECTGFAPNEHFFTDDVPEYVAAAQQVGWDALQFTGYESLVNQLKTRNII